MMAENKMEVMPVGKLIFEMSLQPLFSMFLQYSYNFLNPWDLLSLHIDNYIFNQHS